MSPVPRPLAENAGLAFPGEKPWSSAAVTTAQAYSLKSARNPTGRPNSDVLRLFIGCKSGRPREHWQVDFPLHFTEQEANLYVEPGRHLRAQLGAFAGAWWLNPHANPDLRTAIARLERFLAARLTPPVPAWDWVDSNRLPDDSLLVVARDDDFIHGLLSSRPFQLWWKQNSREISSAAIVAAFPFPWAPATTLSALTRIQEEQRLEVARAARGGDSERLNSAVAAAYNWPAGLHDEELLARVRAEHHRRPQTGL